MLWLRYAFVELRSMDGFGRFVNPQEVAYKPS